MKNQENKLFVAKRNMLQLVGILLLILMTVALLWQGQKNNMQAIPAFAAHVEFRGEYRIQDGPWQPIEEEKHIPATKGDVTLRGNFHLLAPWGEYIGLFQEEVPLAFYMNHINLTIYESGREPFTIENENPIYGASLCGEAWGAYSFLPGQTEPIEIVIHNPHVYGNDTAIDEMLQGMAIWGNSDFEKEILNRGETQRDIGIVFVIFAILFLGTAIFSSLIHVKNSKTLWLIGLAVLFAGVYITYSASGISFWQDSIVSNTIIRQASMRFYMIFLSMFLVHLLEKTQKTGNIVIWGLCVANGGLFLLPLISRMLLYDTLPYWVGAQLVANLILIGCLVKEFINTKERKRWLYLGMMLTLIAFGCDAVMIMLGVWGKGIATGYVFVLLFVVAMAAVVRIIPHSINAVVKAKELETEKRILNAELTESRVSTMMSQIRPHFIYNTLGSIEQLCKLDPPKAAELVHNFAKYLRGNFRELDNPRPILMSQEMEHVHHYISIESVRFSDMTFIFDMNSDNFQIPALTIQPIVENAIKHGLMKLEKGGTIHVVSYETDTHYCVLVEDDGVGFDTDELLDERKHVGIRNIRGRLKEMVGGDLQIESTIGVGTKALIIIPKEGKNGCNSSR